MKKLDFRVNMIDEQSKTEHSVRFSKSISVGSAKPEKFEAKKKVGSKWGTENRGTNHYLGVQKEGSNWDTENRGANHYLGVQRAQAVGGFGGMNRAIEDNEGSKTRIVEAVVEAVAGFGDFSSTQVDIKKGMVTVVGKSVPVGVALKVREMGFRAKLLSLGPATEEEDPDEEHNEDLYHNYPSTTRDDRYPTGIVTGKGYL